MPSRYRANCSRRVALSFLLGQSGSVSRSVSAPLPYPALHASHAGIWIATANGETRRVSRGDAIALAAETPVILLNAPLVAARLGYGDLSGLDLLELFAFLHPARFMVPTVKGLARITGLDMPRDESGAAHMLKQAAQVLLETAQGEWPEREGAWTCAQAVSYTHLTLPTKSIV